MAQDRVAVQVYSQWRQLKCRTAQHPVLCECGDCRHRKQLAQKIQLPYAGEPQRIRLRN